MLKIGTRGSHLATTQAGHVRDALIAGGAEAELHIVTTAGDLNMSPVERIGVGVFTTALRDALASGEVDVAVHSFKDLPTAGDARLHLVTPEREDNREALIARDGLTLAQLPQGAKVGTSAPRRVSQLRALRPDLDILPLRGNIETRMSYVERGELDAIVLAYAGLCRGGYAERATEVFDPATLMPAPAQGALAVECRADDAATRAALDALVSAEATACAAAERQVLATLEAGCTAPVAAYAELGEHGALTLHAGVFAVDGSAQLVETLTGTDAAALGREAAEKLLERGAADIME
ncbi:hydroxymethylbilane synthase [Corynebacterium gottingense]|uniref:Porphobilinogen deaminase n=1 Tax=Corynebacterium gottingense TaxID=2041036 RepID=A0ABX9UP62_9CORY|nr:hydroxymethylbilane synthase [Corynebacterium gottingense]RMD20580.1 hydroxymethylbilane synthase [Corynebacterium gottingense]WJZ12229.1 Porphobilinogen deaminase [Corynebacterium gottingense]WJZ14548.1 Porphobilinogen deaminase [Corynebacterium gottingense]